MPYVVSLNEFARLIRKLPDDAERAIVRGLRSSALRLEGMVPEEISSTSPFPPQDTGELSRSVRTTRIRKGAVVTVDAPHAPFMEYGTRPHMPPLAPLMEWCLRKRLADNEEEAVQVARRIAKKIARYGISPRHFMKRALKRLVQSGFIKNEIRRELNNMER